MRSFKYSFLLLFLFIIPFYVSAEEQEHLTYSGSSYSVPFEYYSSDVNVPIEYATIKSGSNTNYVLRTVDGSYGFFTAYYNNSHNVTSYDNEIYLLPSGSSYSLTFNVNNSDHNLLKVVFTPARQLQEGEYFTSDEFIGYSLLSFNSYTSSYIQNVISSNFGTITDSFTFSANILYYYNSSSTSDVTFMSYYSSSTRTSKFLTFNPSTGAFCNAADTSNCIYPNIQSGEPFNIRVEYIKSTYDFIVNINDEVLTFNRQLKLSSYPFFEFPDNSLSNNPYYYPNSLLLNSVTISEGSKYIKFYPTVINLGGSDGYKCVIGWTSNTNNFYDYYLDNTANSFYSYTGQKLYGSDVSPLFYIDKTIINSGGSGGSASSGSFYERIYPPRNVTPIADWVTRIRSTYERMGKEHYALYMTRYNKELDSLVGYYILFDPKDASSQGKITYALNSDNTLSVTLSDDMYTNFSLTTIFDHDMFANFTPVENGAVGDDLLNYKNWNTYNTIYLDPNEIGFWSSLFGSTNLINFGSNVFANKKYTYSDLEIAKTITFSPIVTNTKDLYENPLVFYASTSETDKYLDYYVVLNLSDGVNSTVKDIYNSSWYKDNDTGEHVLSYYSVMPYLNISFSFGGRDNETTIITSPSTDFDYSDTSYGKYGDEILDAIKSESEMKSFSPLQILSENLATLTDLLLGITDDVSSIFYQINDNSSYYYTYLESMNDTTTYSSRGSFISNELITTTKFMSEELQWIYENTPLNVPINIGLCTSLIMAVIF